MVKLALYVRLEAKPGKEQEVAAALMAKAGDLLSQPPRIEKVDVLAAKLQG
jgi:quinol monooxygenase YgiN